jgi:DNA-binding NtrC family response regulator
MSTLLVIDDDRATLHLMQEAFGGTTIDVCTATNAEDGLRLAAKAPDAVVLDIVLPDLSGFDAARRIRGIDASLPVIFITAHGTSETAIEAMKAGAFDYLPKPLDLPRMRDLVDRAVRMRRSPPAASAGVPGEGNGPSRRGVFGAGGRAAQGDALEHHSVWPASDLAPFLERQLRRQSQTIYSDALAMMERYVLTRVLQNTNGNQSQAAKLLGITRGCLRSRIRAQRISVDTRISCEDDPELSEIDTGTAAC